MSELAVVATFYRRPWAIPAIAQAIREQERPPDRIWMVYEENDDAAVLIKQDWGCASLPLRVKTTEGENPIALAINQALDADVRSDYITYLTDDSLPHPGKYRLMTTALDENADWMAVYCSQAFGRADSPEQWLASRHHSGLAVRVASEPCSQPWCVVDHTQVMHRRTDVRWPTDMGSRKWSDGAFFRSLVENHGPLMPIGEVLDWTFQLPDGVSAR